MVTLGPFDILLLSESEYIVWRRHYFSHLLYGLTGDVCTKFIIPEIDSAAYPSARTSGPPTKT